MRARQMRARQPAEGWWQDQKTQSTQPGEYYVSVRDGKRAALLLGPFTDDHQAALDMVDAVRAKSAEIDPRAVFYSYGTCRVWGVDRVPIRPGSLNRYFGLPTTREECEKWKATT